MFLIGPVLPSSKDLPDNPPLINPERPGLVPPSTNQGKAPDFVAPGICLIVIFMSATDKNLDLFIQN